EERAAALQPLAAEEQAPAARDGVLDVARDLRDGAIVDQRADAARLVVARARDEGRDALGDGVHEAIEDGGVDVDPLRRDAALPGVPELGDHQAVDGGLEVGVVEHDEGRVPAELEGDALSGARTLGEEELPDMRSPGAAELSDGSAAGGLSAEG